LVFGGQLVLSAKTRWTEALVVTGQVYQTVYTSAFTVELRSNDIKIPGKAAIVSTVDGVGTKVSQLQETSISGRQEKGNLSQGTHRSPPGAASSEAFAQHL
jgi:hypothetical protein